MSTRKNINATLQVKEINNQRWICQRVKMTETTTSGDYDFLDNADGFLWKKIRPWSKMDMKNHNISGQSQHLDDKIRTSTNTYMNDDYVDDYFE